MKKKYADLKCRGYVYKKVDFHPHSTSRGYVLEHRLEMEKYLGRYLLPKEIVHHKDGNKENNKIENLELIDGLSKHRNLHEIKKTYYLDKFKDYIIKRYNSGIGSHRIAKEVKSNKASILKWLKKNNIRIRKPKKKVLYKNGFKWCNICESFLNIDEFYRNKNTYDGLRNRCKKCTKKEVSIYYQKNKGEFK